MPDTANGHGIRRLRYTYRHNAITQNATTEGNLKPNSLLPKMLSDPAARINPNGGFNSSPHFRNDHSARNDGSSAEASKVKISSYQSFALAARIHVGTRYTADSRAMQSVGAQRRGPPRSSPDSLDSGRLASETSVAVSGKGIRHQLTPGPRNPQPRAFSAANRS